MPVLFFFFNDTAPTEIYPLPLHAALPIWRGRGDGPQARAVFRSGGGTARGAADRTALGARSALRPPRRGAIRDRKSTRLNSSHSQISYAVFCLKKKQ